MLLVNAPHIGGITQEEYQGKMECEIEVIARS